MIALVRGEVALRRTDHVVVLCAGVGYRLAVSAETLRHVPAQGSEVTLYSHMTMHNEALQLYGFATEAERDLFLMLLSVQNVGPKVALGVLSSAPPRELLAILAAGDAVSLQAAPGVGKRTAERIVVELRERAGALAWPESADGGPAPDPAERRAGGARTLARDGLLELGYAPAEVERLLADAHGSSAAELIAQALAVARER